MEQQNLQIFAYEKMEDGIRIWRCFSYDTRAVIPKSLEGLPVTEIGPYAFSAHMDEKEFQEGLACGRIHIYNPYRQTNASDAEETGKELLQKRGLWGERLEEIVLSDRIVRVGRYCFYNCENLKGISFGGQVQDWGSGAFTGCHQVKKISVVMEEGEVSTLKDVLAELREELCVEYQTARGAYAKLYFPEYYEEGVENTPARILETHVHGSGLYYRNCFVQRKFHFQEYDSRFAYAKAQESTAFLIRLVTARLRFPYQLSEGARERYEIYVREKIRDFAAAAIEERNFEEVKWLAENFGREKEELLDAMIELSGGHQNIEIISYLMNFKHEVFGKKKKRRGFEW